MSRRGATTNPTPRFDRLSAEAFDDGWDSLAEILPAPATEMFVDASRSIITRNSSPDVGFDRSINPYRGCEHGCAYCFARPGHSYLDLSPGLDFETKIFMKPDAPRLLEAELRHKKYSPAPIAIGTNTDPYQPVENKARVMRGVLEVLSAFNHPVTIITKGALILRDLDLLADMAARDLTAVAISVTTLDRALCRKLEPRAAPPALRIEVIRRLAEAGIPVRVMAAPMIPFLNDAELENILEAAHAAGATQAAYILLRLPHEVKDLFAQWLDIHFPAKAAHVLSLVSQSRGGKAYDAQWGTRFTGTGGHAQLLSQRFHLACKRLGFGERDVALDCSKFKPPPRAGDQLSLF